MIFNFTNNGFPMEKERVQNSDDICLAQFTPVSSLHVWRFILQMLLQTKINLKRTFLFQTKNLEEQRLRGQLSHKASGAEGRAGVREGEGV